jgi:glycine cleavage system H lipoate-binding protein
MTVLLVLFTFILFLLIDHFKSRGKVFVPAPVRLIHRLTNGFYLPENLLYHPGHTWALEESPSLVRVGMDDFASKLLGKVDSIKLPNRNTWVRQGQKFATIVRGGKAVHLVSPVEGTVIDVNGAALEAREDPYNSGWLMTVNSPDKKTCFRNLLRSNVAAWFIENAVGRLHPALAQDGGEAVDDFAVAMGKDWESTTKEFLLD